MGLSRARAAWHGVGRRLGRGGPLGACVVLAAVLAGGRAGAQDVISPGTTASEVMDGPEGVTTIDEVVTTTDTGPGDPCATVTCLDPDPGDCITYTCMSGACEAVLVASDVALGVADVACQPADPCAAGGACAPDGSCMPTAFIDCSDGDACTFDGCDAGTCVHVLMPCDDGLGCTTDVCIGGQCSFTPTPACGGGCVPADCDDGNACTHDLCVGGACVASPIAAPCDDGDGCTRDDQCVAGLCMPGAAKVCDDGTACTADTCDPATGQCTYPRAAGACELCAEPGGETERFTASLDLSVPLGVDCPLVGGRAGVVLTAQGALQAERQGCPACRASVSGDVALSAEVTLCQGAVFNAAASGKFAASRNYGTTCDTDSCLLACGEAFCESERFTGFAGLGVSRFLGFQRRWRAGGAAWGERGTLEVGVRCGVAVRGEVGVEGRFAGSEDGGAGGACEDCAASAGALVLGVEGRGGCAVDLRAGPWTTTLACPGCAWLGVEADAHASQRDGACAGATTSAPSATSDATVTTPCLEVGLGWYAVAAACEATLAGSCDADGCDTDAAVARCTVLGGACE